jgi:hypothetical protein
MSLIEYVLEIAAADKIIKRLALVFINTKFEMKPVRKSVA